MNSGKMNIFDLEFDELKNEINKLGEPVFRAKQVWQWIYQGADSFDNMTNLSKALRDKLKESFYIGGASIVERLISKKDGTRKYLFALRDGKVVESVLMRYRYGNSVCLSTQIGCRMGCSFCASSKLGMDRNLSVGEMVAQVIAIQNDTGQRVSHIVLMGIGEPFDNYDNVIKFLRRMNQEDTLNISYRRMTVSTCGLVPEIIRFAKEEFPVNLSVSLHAPNDEVRRSIMPIARKYPFDKILTACHIYTQQTGRRITFEYTLINGINDGNEHAKELGERLSGLLCHINLIPVNTVEESGYIKSDNKRVDDFKKIIEGYGLPVTVRRELGSDISAACGQLRKKSVESDRMVD
ncbi:MAG: 23S rRNA (adenine(2503)-C(2))-methyltransferase RlmN [Clostridiaceae bacterium]|jgi:23S rRNA (adenine2503-C2)-methyltransferase|nr:23S rRNA (adenine(2503)-C(2))-methyltransferase RlmN [Clostridiaceae bacterium]